MIVISSDNKYVEINSPKYKDYFRFPSYTHGRNIHYHDKLQNHIIIIDDGIIKRYNLHTKIETSSSNTDILLHGLSVYPTLKLSTNTISIFNKRAISFDSDYVLMYEFDNNVLLTTYSNNGNAIFNSSPAGDSISNKRLHNNSIHEKILILDDKLLMVVYECAEELDNSEILSIYHIHSSGGSKKKIFEMNIKLDNFIVSNAGDNIYLLNGQTLYVIRDGIEIIDKFTTRNKYSEFFRVTHMNDLEIEKSIEIDVDVPLQIYEDNKVYTIGELDEPIVENQ